MPDAHFLKSANLYTSLIFNYEVEPNEENRALKRPVELIFIPKYISKVLTIYKVIKLWESFPLHSRMVVIQNFFSFPFFSFFFF